MYILALNSGSSSIKCALIDSVTGTVQFALRIENIGTPVCRLVDGATTQSLGALTYEATIALVLGEVSKRLSIATSLSLAAVAHRVVHGGSRFTQPTIVDESVLHAIAELSAQAPLHNPPALATLRAARQAFSAVPHIAVFDTAFHSTLPASAREYALPRDLARRHGLRRYGFHGINHAHVMLATAEFLQIAPQKLRIISCHLGNGASLTAIEYGRSVDTSMGMTPLEGLVMGTRAGDIDPGVLLHLLQTGEYTPKQLDHLLNSESGLLGLTNSFDFAEIERRAEQGDADCRFAITLYTHRIGKYIGAYAAVMGGVDAIVFTGGVGEHSAIVRHLATQRLEFLGAVLDEERNRDAQLTTERTVIDISAETSRTRLLVVAADEQQQLVRDASALCRS